METNYDIKNTSKTNKLNFTIAIIYYIFNISITSIYSYIYFNTDLYNRLFKITHSNLESDIIANFPLIFIQLLPIFYILYKKEKNLSYIGLSKKHVLSSIPVGLISTLPLIALMMYFGDISNNYLDLRGLFLRFTFHLFCIALVEEIVFRGFLQQIVSESIKNKFIATFLVGILFSASHIPFKLIGSNLSIIDVFNQNIGFLISAIIIHLYLLIIYKKSQNLSSAILTHAIINLMSEVLL